MSVLTPVRLVCSKCGERKNAVDMTRDKSRRSGYGSWCRSCTNEATKRRTRERLAEDAEAERARARARTQESRSNPAVREREKASQRARNAAIGDLIAAHRTEFDHLVRVRRHEAGL